MDLDEEELKSTRKMNGADKSKADRMFEEFGYIKIEGENLIIYRMEDGYYIEFCQDEKTFRKVIFYTYSRDITMQELQAINEKCKELRLDMKVVMTIREMQEAKAEKIEEVEKAILEVYKLEEIVKNTALKNTKEILFRELNKAMNFGK